ncbi:hypothetical protein lerEdw1_010065 [Lerista edwardsae]|nr:hypothetical protein lerEdw1_010065 [Lerista edwardsae]
MDLRLQKPAFWASLHLRGNNLRGWALGRELALGTTCDQLPQAPEEVQSTFALQGGRLEALMCSSADALLPSPLEAGVSEVRPHLWMWVDPNLACPIPGRCSAEMLLPPPRPSPAAGAESAPSSPTPACLWEERLPLPSEAAEKAPQGGDASRPGAPPPAEGTRRPVPGEAPPRKAKGTRGRGRKPRRAQGSWPRPPLNYCVLISLALSSSVDSSLTVQEIYQFTRQHFPFFRTAPEGWKNTVRHNLCFSSSFEKTTDFVHLEGSRKSRLWRLTAEGQRRFQEETRALPEDTMGLVHESMERPELSQLLFGL